MYFFSILLIVATIYSTESSQSLRGVNPETLIEKDTRCKAFRKAFPCSVTKPSDCSSTETFVEKDIFFGCCAACVTYKGPTSPCTLNSYYSHYSACAPGHTCLPFGFCV
ncbi:hypothetical protein C0J52_23113 [Blattella germanica]|nr:hypothetical protein C0J52_23113 [Blattella germanica]